MVTGRFEGMYGFLALAARLKSKDEKVKRDYEQICGDKDFKTCIDDIVYTEIGGSSV